MVDSSHARCTNRAQLPDFSTGGGYPSQMRDEVGVSSYRCCESITLILLLLLEKELRTDKDQLLALSVQRNKYRHHLVIDHSAHAPMTVRSHISARITARYRPPRLALAARRYQFSSVQENICRRPGIGNKVPNLRNDAPIASQLRTGWAGHASCVAANNVNPMVLARLQRHRRRSDTQGGLALDSPGRQRPISG